MHKNSEPEHKHTHTEQTPSTNKFHSPCACWFANGKSNLLSVLVAWHFICHSPSKTESANRMGKYPKKYDASKKRKRSMSKLGSNNSNNRKTKKPKQILENVFLEFYLHSGMCLSLALFIRLHYSHHVLFLSLFFLSFVCLFVPFVSIHSSYLNVICSLTTFNVWKM